MSPSGIPSWTPWGQGIGSAVWIHAVAGLPWVILLVGQGLTWRRHIQAGDLDALAREPSREVATDEPR